MLQDFQTLRRIAMLDGTVYAGFPIITYDLFGNRGSEENKQICTQASVDNVWTVKTNSNDRGDKAARFS